MIIIQLSDPHILAPGELLYGRVDTAEFLARSVAEINRLDPLPDIAVVTGDLVDHGEPAEYEHLRALLAFVCEACRPTSGSFGLSLIARSALSTASLCAPR